MKSSHVTWVLLFGVSAAIGIMGMLPSRTPDPVAPAPAVEAEAADAPDEPAAEPGEKAEAAEPGEKAEAGEDAEGDGEASEPGKLKFDAEKQEYAGLELAALESAPLHREVKAYGRVLDPTPLATLVFERRAAQATAEASNREYKRVKRLSAGGENASARDLEQALAALLRDRSALDAAQAKLVFAWGPTLAGREDLTDLIQEMALGKVALARVDSPPGSEIAMPVSVRASAFLGTEEQLDATLIGIAPSTDAMIQGRGFLVLLRRNAPLPGTALMAWLALPGESHDAPLVPRSAIVRYGGDVFVYVQEAPEDFKRERVVLESPVEDGWLVSQGPAAGAKIVTVGAQQLLAAELGGSEPEED